MRAVPVILLGECCAGFWLGREAGLSLVTGLVGLGEAALLVWLLNRMRVPPVFTTTHDVGVFIILGSIVSPFLAGYAGAGILLFSDWIPASSYWVSGFTWALGDALGILIITPLLTHWWQGKPFARPRDGATWGAIMLGTLLLGLAIMLGMEAPRGLFFLLSSMAVLAAATNGMVGATSVSTLLALCVLGLGLSHGGGTFITVVRIYFVGTATMTAYLLAVLLTERKQVEAQLRHLALYDHLTGLRNRAGFDQDLRERVTRPGTHLLLYLDLAQFKLLNDSFGHQMGDRFLVALAARLPFAVPENAIVARLGGDEFGVLIPDKAGSAAHIVATNLRRTVLDFRYTENELEHRVGVSIGMTQFSDDEQPKTVLSRADIACHMAKREGPNNIRDYWRDDADMLANHVEIERVSQLHAAFKDGRFAVARQRIVPLHETGTGNEPPFYEMLLRLRDTHGRILTPGSFLGAAERYSLMPTIDRWVLEQSFLHYAETPHPLKLSINLYGMTLNDPAIFDDLMDMKTRYGVDANDIYLEVTESIAIQHLSRAVHTMRRLVDVGFHFSLDDFGSGVASFGYLQDLPVDAVKIDGQFIRDIHTNPASPIIVESLVKLSALKGISCIGEWIETPAILSQSSTLGVGYGQGFYLHEPELIAVQPSLAW